VNARVLILLENEPYPHDRRIRYEALALTQAGCDVTVVSPTSERAPESEKWIEGVHVLRFDSPPPGGGALAYMREYLLAGLRMRRLLRRLAREEQPFDVVIACNPPDFLIHLARPLARRGAALIFDFHDPAPELFEGMFERRGITHRVLLALEGIAQRKADVVMTVNEPCADLVRGRGRVAAENVYVLVTCPDPKRFYLVEPRPELRRGHEVLVVWIGRMSRKENLPLLLDAAAELQRQGRTEIGFAIVGHGDIAEELQAQIDERELSDTMFMPGEADDEMLRDWLSTADICVSLDEHSPMNDRSLMVKVMEYMAMGRAIIQFPLTEMKRVCADTTLYARNGDAADLAEQIRTLADSAALRLQLGKAAQMRLLSEGLSWPDQVPTLLAALERAQAVKGQHRRRQLAAQPEQGQV
jgi:glycosyltransferase involved in cell wall biosynthesis